MRKYLSIALILLLCLGLAACGKDDTPATPPIAPDPDEGGDMALPAPAEALFSRMITYDDGQSITFFMLGEPDGRLTCFASAAFDGQHPKTEYTRVLTAAEVFPLLGIEDYHVQFTSGDAEGMLTYRTGLLVEAESQLPGTYVHEDAGRAEAKAEAARIAGGMADEVAGVLENRQNNK